MVSKSRALKKAVQSILDDLTSADSKRQFRGTSKVSKLLRAPQRELEWESDQVIDAVVKVGAVPLLAGFLLRTDDHKLQSEAANALANISAGTSDNTCAVIAAGVVPIATQLLASTSTDLQDHAAWLLANIACENCACVLEAGALEPLLVLLDNVRSETQSEQSLVKTGTWLLSNLCQYTEDFAQVQGCLPRLSKLIRSTDEAVLKDGCWGIMYLCRLSIQAVVDSGVCQRLALLLMHTSDEVCCVALEALCQLFANGSVQHKLAIVDHGVLHRLRYLLHSRRERTREIACTAIANIVRGSAALLPALRDSEVFLCLIHVVATPGKCRASWLTWREAVRALMHAVECAKIDAPGTVKYLVGHGMILALASTVSIAACSSMELCMDPVLRLVEQLADAGAPEPGRLHLQALAGEHGGAQQCSSQAAQAPQQALPAPQQGLPGAPLQLPPAVEPPHARLARVRGNPYAQFLTDVGIIRQLAPAALDDIWKHASSRARLGDTAMPGTLERLAHRVSAMVPPVSAAKGLSLKELARRSLRRTTRYDEIQDLPLPEALRAYVIGLRVEDSSYVRDTATCSLQDIFQQKREGDTSFVRQHYEEAIGSYSAAIDRVSDLSIEALHVTLLLNRSAAYLKLNKLQEVVKDCSVGLQISPGHTKCLHRRAATYEKLGQLQMALDDYRVVKGEEAEAALVRLKSMATQAMQQSKTSDAVAAALLAEPPAAPGPVAASKPRTFNKSPQPAARRPEPSMPPAQAVEPVDQHRLHHHQQQLAQPAEECLAGIASDPVDNTPLAPGQRDFSCASLKSLRHAVHYYLRENVF